MLKNIRIIVLGLFFILGCSENPMEKNIIGKWFIHDYRINMKQPPYEQDRIQEEIEKMKKNSYFIFYKNYEYEVNLNGNIEKGKWKIDPQKKLLSTQKEHSNVEILLNIDTLNSDILVFSSTKDSITTQVSLIKKMVK